MGKRTAIAVICLLLTVAVVTACLTACSNETWDPTKFDLSLPDFTQEDVVSENGWYLVMQDDFNGSALNESTVFGARFRQDNPDLFDESGNIKEGIWTTSPEGLRWESNDADKPEQACYWCKDMVSVADGYVTVSAKQEEGHVCSAGVCPSTGRFTSGIETRAIVSGENSDNKGSSDDILFSQAFGYFECRVKFPDADGLWSAFWLQSSNMRKPAAEGVDGTEIDIYESAFRKQKKAVMGHALLWNGYGEYAKVEDYIAELDTDLYDGNFHTFALKWTPDYYVFYVDGTPTWASRGGGVSHVKEYLRLTVEIDAGDGYGPHGMKIGKFTDSSSTFVIDSVRVYQNEKYEQYIISDDCFSGELDLAN